MPADYMEMASRCEPRRGDGFHVAMRICRSSDGEPATELVGQYVTGRFGTKRIYRGMLTDGDLSPERLDSHGGSARQVLDRLTWGSPGEFKIREDATFVDDHGGDGLAGHLGNTAWFTAAALRRGIGWSFVQLRIPGLSGQGFR